MSEIPEAVRVALDGLRSLGGDDLMKQMVSVFIEYSAGRVQALQTAADSGNLTGVAEAAHSLKGSSRQLGLTAMADACLAAEHAAKQGDGVTTQTLAAAVHEEYTAAAQWLRDATA